MGKEACYGTCALWCRSGVRDATFMRGGLHRPDGHDDRAQSATRQKDGRTFTPSQPKCRPFLERISTPGRSENSVARELWEASHITRKGCVSEASVLLRASAFTCFGSFSLIAAISPEFLVVFLCACSGEFLCVCVCVYETMPPMKLVASERFSFLSSLLNRIISFTFNMSTFQLTEGENCTD